VCEVNRKVLGMAVVFLAVAISASSIVPAFAKNFNYPEGQDITYTSSGEGYIATPAGYFGAVTSMKIRAVNVEIGTKGGGDNLEIDFPVPGTSTYIPVAFFTTNPNPEVIDWLKILLSGFPVLLPNNIRHVSDDVLIVNRHGNSITVELTAPQTILMIQSGVPVPVVVPAFTVELNKVGGSVHQDETEVLTGYPGASDWTGYTEEMGFNAEGALTCQAWSYDSVPMTDCFIRMHGITIWTPPASP
jgi:hypothetical protein